MRDTRGKAVREIIDQCLKLTPCDLDVRYDEPMREHTTFKVGGPADCWLRPRGEGFPCFSASLLRHARAAGIPVFILGGGANIVVSDKGIRGIVLDTSEWKGGVAVGEEISFLCGTTMDEAAESAAAAGLSGLEFLAGMPGVIGGAVWMNARCYGSEIADVLIWTEVIDFSVGESPRRITRIYNTPDRTGFDYKRSPFQEKDFLITTAGFNLKSGDKNEILNKMEKNKQDRQEKGHYLFPCAGSAFKNNRDFGKPTGQIIDELGLKGFQIGGAQVTPFHGNIVINTGSATALDIRALMNEVAARIKAATGFILEPEILFVGEW